MPQEIKITVNKYVSQRLSDGFDVVLEHANEFVEKVKEYDPEGRICILVAHKAEKFRPAEKAIANIIDMKKIYNQDALMSSPEMAKESAEIVEKLNEINRIIEKRKDKIRKRRSRYKAQQEAKIESNNNETAENTKTESETKE